jgi:hypothetical protein
VVSWMENMVTDTRKNVPCGQKIINWVFSKQNDKKKGISTNECNRMKHNQKFHNILCAC